MSNNAMFIERLNSECFCLPLADAALRAAVAARLPASDVDWAHTRLAALTAEQPLFLPAALRADLFARIRAVGATLLALADEAGRVGEERAALLAAGVFDSFDFHLTTSGPKLIEVNTNAGGAFLQPLLLDALIDASHAPWFNPEQLLLDAFAALAPGRTLARLAIVDAEPEHQALYLDMRLAAAALERRGIAVDIVDVTRLRRAGHRLHGPSGPIDMVYNRLTDFELQDTAHAVLREAWQEGEIALAPNPDVYRAFADKHLLIELADSERMAELARRSGIDLELIRDTVPPCEELVAANADRLWAARRDYVFKPGRGYGSRGVYRGDKVSRSKWQTLVGQGYLAQRFAAPSERSLKLAGGITPFKVDVRVWTHGIEPVFAAARLYSGQVMGFRAEGAGFAPILWMDPDQPGATCVDRGSFHKLCAANIAGTIP